MNKDVNKLLQKIVKIDLGSGLIISLSIMMISSFINAGIYLVGISVALINFLVSGYIISNYLGKQRKQWIFFISYVIRMGFILITLLPFIKYPKYVVLYLIGFISHYIILLVSNIKNRKGSV